MVLLWPWSTLGFGAVVVAALWALLRPSRRTAIVGSVELWSRAKDAMSKAARHRAKRVTLSWLLLLAGAVACVAAMTRPAVNAPSRSRHIALVLLPSAELGGEGGVAGMRETARRLLDRLDPRDRVSLVLPKEAPPVLADASPTARLTVDEARDALARLAPLPIRAADLASVEPATDVQHVYTLAPAGTTARSGPEQDVIEIPHGLGGVTVEAVGAEETTGGHAEIFVSLRSQRDRMWSGTLRCRGLDAAGNVLWRWGSDKYRSISVSASESNEAIMQVVSSEILVIDAVPLGALDETPALTAYLVRRPVKRTKVAVTGKVNELLTRFIRSDDTLELVDPGDPDVALLIANGVDPLPKIASIVIAPPTPPDGWRRGDEVEDFDLGVLGVAADDPVMRNVLLNKVFVSRFTPWVASDSPLQVIAAGTAKRAVVLHPSRTDSNLHRRVWVAFDMSLENTAFGMSEAYVVMMANAVRHLVPRATGKRTFEHITPVEAGPAGVRTAIVAQEGEASRPKTSSRYPLPGVYRFGQGDEATLHAVNITGLMPASVKVTATAAVMGLVLPDARRETTGIEIWPVLLAMAVLFWLGGWCVRLN